jgi:hypothetical protein
MLQKAEKIRMPELPRSMYIKFNELWLGELQDELFIVPMIHMAANQF